MRPDDYHIPDEATFQTFTNHDAVHDFLDRGREPFAVGDTFTLPDIGQAYTLVKVSYAESKSGQKWLYLALQTICAFEGCETEFVTLRQIRELRQSPYLTRCCPDHRRMFMTPMANAWKSADWHWENNAKPAPPPKPAKRSGPPVRPRTDLEKRVLRLAEEMALVRDRIGLVEFGNQCAAYLAPPLAGRRDTRQQVAVRAARRLSHREPDGSLHVRGDTVYFD